MNIAHLWLIGGGVLASTFLKEGYLTHIGISLTPIVLGGGIKMFDELLESTFLVQESSSEISGFTHVNYRICP